MTYIPDYIDTGEDRMRIAVLSGKGGTGKTLLSVNMAAVADKSKYIDCDVEEPNGHLFLKPKEVASEDITVKVPVVDEEKCNGCRICVEFCKFNALAYTGEKLIVFDEICHSCGGCTLFCPEKALSERDRVIGRVERGISENVTVISGILNMGEAIGIPIIEDILTEELQDGEIHMIDSPPGSSCAVMETIRDADYCILVAEPTLFGLHNLNIVYELVKLFHKPYGVVLNKCLDEERLAEEFCTDRGMNILEKIPFDRELGSLSSDGLIAARESEKYKKLFSNLLNRVIWEVHHETVTNP